MGDISFFIDDLMNRAKRQGNEELIKKLSDKDYIKSFYDVIKDCKNLGLELISKESTTFDPQKEINLKISRALAQNYFTMYYVNMRTNEYMGYSSSDDYRSLCIVEDGKDFFKEAHKNLNRVVYYKDIDKLRDFLDPKVLYEKTKDGNSTSITYRLLMNNVPTFVTLKALRLANDENLIVGISNIDQQMKTEYEYKQAMEENATYYNIAISLVRNYFAVYYVNVDNFHYIEYSIDGINQKLTKASSGDDFFGESKQNALKLLLPEDQKKFLDAIEKNNLLKEVNSGKPFKITYRQLINDTPTFVQLTAINLINDNNHIIVAVSNIDAQRKRDLEYAKNLELEKTIARTDALTGAKNKYCYIETEDFVNTKIKNQTMSDFSVLVCDINNLKTINDTFGHDVGDRIIKDAKNLLSSIFTNSSVFRTGGDEFVLILEGSDYYKRDYLVKKINEANFKNKDTYNLVLANGYSDFDSKKDKSVLDVFKRADEKMYNNKRMLKG